MKDGDCAIKHYRYSYVIVLVRGIQKRKTSALALLFRQNNARASTDEYF